MALLVGLLFFGSRSVATALIVTMMVGLAGGFSFVTYATVLVEQTPAGRGTTMSLSGILASGAATIGGALGGLVLWIALTNLFNRVNVTTRQVAGSKQW